MSEIRPLTREEQLIWMIKYCRQEISYLKKELMKAKRELKLLQQQSINNECGKSLSKTKKNEMNNLIFNSSDNLIKKCNK